MRTKSALMENEIGNIIISIHSGHVNFSILIRCYRRPGKNNKQNSPRGNQPLDFLSIPEI